MVRYLRQIHQETFNGPQQLEAPYIQFSGTSLIQTNDGGYALACNPFALTAEEAELAKADSTGKLIWDDSYIKISAGFVAQASDGGLVWGGNNYYQGPASSNVASIWLNKTDSSSNLLWGKTFGTNMSSPSIAQLAMAGILS